MSPEKWLLEYVELNIIKVSQDSIFFLPEVHLLMAYELQDHMNFSLYSTIGNETFKENVTLAFHH